MIGKILTRLFALFGMTLTCVACYGVVEAEYMPDWSASGRVVDPEGNAIQGIKVSMSPSQECFTNPNGRFFVSGWDPVVHIEDVDGVENGGEFEGRTIELYKQDGEFVGSDLGEIELKRKQQE